MGKQLRKQEELITASDAERTLDEGQGDTTSNAVRQDRLPGAMAAPSSEGGSWASGLQPDALSGEMTTAEFDAVTLPSGGSQRSFHSTTATPGAPGSAQVSSQSASRIGSGRSRSEEIKVSEHTVTVDESGTVAANQDLLRNALVDREVTLAQKRGALERARSAGDTGRVATLEAEVSAQDDALSTLRQTIDAASSLADIEAAARASGVDPAQLKTVDRAVEGTSLRSKSASEWSRSGYTSTDSATLELLGDKGDSSSTYASSTTTQVGFSGGKFSGQRGQSTTSAQRKGDITEATTVDKSTQASFGDKGVQVSRKLSETNTIADADGTVVTDKQATAVGGGFDGKQLSGNVSTSKTTLGGATVENQGGASLTKDSVGLQATRSGSQKDGDGTAAYSFGGVFNLTFRVDPIPDSNPPRFQSVFKVRGGASLGGSGKSEGAHKDSGAAGEASMGISASASVELSHTQTLSDEDVARYRIELSEWETTGKAPSGLPAFSIDRLRALVKQVSDPGPALALLSAEAAAGMETGESMAMALDGHLGVNGGGSAKMGSVGVSGSASMSGSLGRDIAVSKTSDGLVKVFLSFDSAKELAGKLGVSVEVVSASLGGSSASSEGCSATFLLDPKATAYSYSSVFASISGCMSSGALQALAADPALRAAGAVIATTREAADSDELGGTISNRLVTVGSSQSSAGSEKITESNGKVSGVFTGSNTDSDSVGAGALKLGLTSKGDATAKVSSDGEFGLSVTDTETAMLPTLKPSMSLSAMLQAAYPDRYQIDLSDSDMKTLLARAGGDATRWEKCCQTYFKSRGGVTTIDAWNALASKLSSPVPDPNYAATQPLVATRLSQAAAIAEFMRWPEAHKAVYRLCNEYGASLHSDSRNIGRQSEWPSALSDQRARLDGATKRLTGLPAQLASDETDVANGYLRGLHRCTSIRADLAAVKKAIEQNMAAFDHQATALEMMARIDSQIVDLDALESDFTRHFDHGESLTDAASDVDSELATEPLQSAPDLSQVTLLEGKLGSFQAREAAMFAKMRSNITSETQGALSRVWTALTSSYGGVHDAQQQLRELYEGWKYTVIDLRAAYTSAGVTGDWKVSRDHKAARTGLEPDVETFKQLHEAAAAEHPVIANGHDDVMTWVSQYERY